MSQAALSPLQFSGSAMNTPAPAPEPIRAPINEPGSPTPLSYSSQTNSAAKQAAVWRKPANVGYSAATAGSVFNPNAI